MEIIVHPVTPRAVATPVQKGTAANVPVFNLSDYYQTDLLVRIKLIKDL